MAVRHGGRQHERVQRSKRPAVNRREFVRRARRPPPRWPRLRLVPDCAGAQACRSEFDGSKFQLKAPEPNPKSGGVLRYGITIAAAAFRRAPVGHHQQPGQPGLHVRQPGPPRSARQRQDHHSRSRAQLGDLQGRQDLHLLPAQGRAVPRRRRAHLGGRQGHLRPHRQAAAGHHHPAQHPVRRGRARSTRRDKHTVQFKLSEPRPPDFIMSAHRQRLERASSARRRWRTTSTTCAASSTFPAPARSRASAASRTKSG